MTSLKHTHQYQRKDIGEYNKELKKNRHVFVMACVLPSCSHYIRMKSKLSCQLLKGKEAICNRCDGKFLLDKRSLRMAEPCCEDCVDKRIPVAIISEADKFFEQLQKDMGIDDTSGTK